MKNIIIYCAFATVSILACSCASSDKSVSCTMGVILPLSGTESAAAREILDGMRLARTEINANGGVAGIPLEFDVRDFGNKDFSFFEAFDSMRARGVKVFHLGLSKDTVLLNRVTSKCDDAFVNWFSNYPPVTLEGENSVRIFINGAQEGDIMSKAVARGDSEVNIVVMNVDNLAGKSLGDYLSFNLKLDKTNLYHDVFGADEKNFAVFDEQIKRLFAEYVFYAGTGAELGAFAKSLSNGGFSGDIIASCSYFPSEIKHSAKMEIKEVSTLFALGKINTRVSRAFRAAFEKKYGRSPSWLAAYGYDAVKLTANALAEARFIPANMRAKLADKSFECAIGKITFDKSGDSLSELTLVEK